MSDSNAASVDTSSDEAVSQFLAVTGSLDASQASSYLEMSGGNLETAIGLFMEHGGGGGGGGGLGGGLGGSGGNVGNDVASSYDDLGATSYGTRRYDTNSNNNNSNSSSNNPPLQPGEVRAPDETRRMRLMDFDDGPSHGAGAEHAAMMRMMGGHMGGMIDPREAMGAFAAPSAFQNDEVVNRMMNNVMAGSGSFRDVLNRAAAAESSSLGMNSAFASGGNQTSNENASDDSDDEVQDVTPGHMNQPPRNSGNALNDMYAPPTALMHMGGFQSARSAAKDSKRWLLVSLTHDADFACHALNRDVWRDELVENLIREGFVFWQERNDHPEGQTYGQRYHVTCYPHVAIIDPRTGRSMWKKEGWTQQNPMTASMFAEIATDFCSRHRLDDPPAPPRLNTASTSNSNTAPATSSATTREMTEEEQLQAAIRASMNDDDDDDDSDVCIMEEDDDDGAMGDDSRKRKADASESIEENEGKPAAVEDNAPKEPTFEDEIASMVVADEPEGSAGVARIMLRMPDGKRVVRKFNAESKVKEIYAFIAQSYKDVSEGRSFECKAGFPPKDLLPSVDETIGSSGLAGDNITVRWK